MSDVPDLQPHDVHNKTLLDNVHPSDWENPTPEGRYNLGTWPTGGTRDHTFEEPGIYTQLCNIHPDMLAFVVVLETPHFTVTDAKGSFEVEGVPSGKYLLWAWHEKKDGLEREITVEAGQVLDLDLVIER